MPHPPLPTSHHQHPPPPPQYHLHRRRRRRSTKSSRSPQYREILYCIERYSLVVVLVSGTSSSNVSNDGDDDDGVDGGHSNAPTSTCSGGAASQIPLDLYECSRRRSDDDDDDDDGNRSLHVVISSPTVAVTRACAQRTRNRLAVSSSFESSDPNNNNNNNNNNIVECTTDHHLATTVPPDAPTTAPIRYVTHHVLLHEMMRTMMTTTTSTTSTTPWQNYDYPVVILINQVHSDRTVATDLLLGLLRQLLRHCDSGHQPPWRLVLLLPHRTNNNNNNNNNNDPTQHDVTTTILEYFLGGSPERAQQPGILRHSHHHCPSSTGTSTSSSSNNNTAATTTTHPDDDDQDDDRNNGILLSLLLEDDDDDDDHHRPRVKKSPVDIYHTLQPVPDLWSCLMDTIWSILLSTSHPGGGTGNVLCFVPRRDDIVPAMERALEFVQQPPLLLLLQQRDIHVEFVPLGRSVSDQVVSPFETQRYPTTTTTTQNRGQSRPRRVIFTNLNVERTSMLWIPNIQFVIDTGYMEVPCYWDATIGLYRHHDMVVPISRAVAQLRASYAMTPPHRTTTTTTIGHCYRLYTGQYLTQTMIQSTPPEILRTDVTPVILFLKSMGIDNLLTFDFITLPNLESIRYGLETLYVLGALDDNTNLTRIGSDLCQLWPVDPRLARMCLAAIPYHCTWEVLTIASVLHVSSQQLPPGTNNDEDDDDCYGHYRPYRLLSTKPKLAPQQILDYENVRSNVADVTGDHLSYWNIFSDLDERYHGNVDRDYCREHFLHYPTIRRCLTIRKQLARMLKRLGSTTTTIGTFRQGDRPLPYDRSEAVLRCVTTGYLMNVAKLHSDGQYYTIRNNQNDDKVLVVPSKCSFYTQYSKITSEYIIFCQSGSGGGGGPSSFSSSDGNDAIEIQHVSSVEAKWLRDIAPHYFE